MKYLIMMAVFVSPVVHAKVYKCQLDGKILYQQKPCVTNSEEIVIDASPSEEEQAAARARLDNYQINKENQARLDQERDDKERLIRAEENKADAAYKNAQANRAQAAQQARQAEALERKNIIDTYRRY
ncbi:MAG: DUF4124 domain-containing protein [Methylococcaceae bacterium]|nr:DUF4124 domain-containing protein [Methylococcaceae bacterium]